MPFDTRTPARARAGPGHVARQVGPRRLLALAVAVSACAGEISNTGPTLVVVRQPSLVIVNQTLAPAVEVRLEDGAGHPLGGSVTIAIDSNPCAWALQGTTTVAAVDGRAVFGDLRIGRVAKGYRLVVSSGGLQAVTASFDVADAVGPGERLVQQHTLCAKPNPQKDAESLEYVPVDDAFWLADDNVPSIFEVARATGQYRAQIPASRFIEAFPAAASCDDQDNDPTTSCSYVGEFEHVAYDAGPGLLYVMNTVNSPQVTPQKDYPAIFKLRRQGCHDCWGFEDWRPLPTDAQYEGLVVIGSALYVAIGRRVYPYDFDQNLVLTADASGNPLPPTYTAESKIERLHYDGVYLWAILDSNVLKRVDLNSGVVVASYDLSSHGLDIAKGVEMIGDQLYVLDGGFPNPIYVFQLR